MERSSCRSNDGFGLRHSFLGGAAHCFFKNLCSLKPVLGRGRGNGLFRWGGRLKEAAIGRKHDFLLEGGGGGFYNAAPMSFLPSAQYEALTTCLVDAAARPNDASGIAALIEHVNGEVALGKGGDQFKGLGIHFKEEVICDHQEMFISHAPTSGDNVGRLATRAAPDGIHRLNDQTLMKVNRY